MKQFWMIVNDETGEVIGLNEPMTQLEALKVFVGNVHCLDHFKMVPNVKTWQAFNPLKTR